MRSSGPGRKTFAATPAVGFLAAELPVVLAVDDLVVDLLGDLEVTFVLELLFGSGVAKRLLTGAGVIFAWSKEGFFRKRRSWLPA